MNDLPSLCVLIPVLGRPANAPKVIAILQAATPSATFMFLCSPTDSEEITACEQLGWTIVMEKPAGQGDYAYKLNHGYQTAIDHGYEWMFLGADDLVFHDHWYELCLDAHHRGNACVIGTKDLGNKRTMNGWHSTHTLVHRDYLECGTIDEEGIILCPLYQHEFVDDEFIHTARMRRTYVGSQAIVEHNHPDWGKAEWDDTYRKAQANRTIDQALYNSRRAMFASRQGR